MRGRSAPGLFALFLLLIAFVIALPAFGQTTTATIRGKVVNERGNVIGNAEINAVSTTSGFVITVHSRGDGTYTLAGLTPGEYNIIVAAQG